jgi:hypothetical protein
MVNILIIVTAIIIGGIGMGKTYEYYVFDEIDLF